MRDPTVLSEAVVWSTRLRTIGIDNTPDELLAMAAQGGQRLNQFRSALLVPAGPYFRWCGTWQGWRMFVAPHRFPTRVSLEIHEGNAWRTLYREGGPENWYKEALRHERFRSVLFAVGWESYPVLRQRFTEFLANRAVAEFPEADAFRLRLVRERTRRPAEVLRGDPIAVVGAPVDVVVQLGQ